MNKIQALHIWKKRYVKTEREHGNTVIICFTITYWPPVSIKSLPFHK